MASLLFHPETEKQLSDFLARPSTSILLHGKKGSGKTSTLNLIARRLLEIKEDSLDSYPYLLRIEPDDKDSITIESIRIINHFLARKVPGNKPTIRRVIIIDDAERMTLQAQNALLKNLEEPPAGTAFLLSTSEPNYLLPTVKSRTMLIRLSRPKRNDLKQFLQQDNNNLALVNQAINISAGLPGLAYAIAAQVDNHPLVKAAALSKQLLSTDRYERLAQVNTLSKDHKLFQDTLVMLKQMATIALETAEDIQSERWKNVLMLSQECQKYLEDNANFKLTLTYFMLNL